MDKKQLTVYVDDYFLSLLREFAFVEDYPTSNKALAAIALDFLEEWKASQGSKASKGSAKK